MCTCVSSHSSTQAGSSDCCGGRAQKQRDANGNEVLSPLDRLFIVHVWREGKHRERERWSTGGPLLRGLDVALANYRHSVVELEVRAC